MNIARISSALFAVPILVVLACAEPKEALAPSFAQLDDSRHTIVVNPNANGNGIARTIQDGIDRVAAGGTVLVKAGTYAEALVIDKGLTLAPIGDGNSPVIVAPAGTPVATITVATPSPVTIRDLTVWKPGSNGILGNGVVDITIERVTLRAVATGPGTNRLVRMANNASVTGGRGRLVVRESVLDGAGLETNAVSLQADIDAVVVNNTVRRMGGICMFFISVTAAGINADIVNNDLDGCEGRTAIDVGPTPTQTTGFSTVGVVNIIGNTIRNSSASCLPTTAIHYQLYTGRIERNSIIGFLQPCAAAISDALPGAIWVGSIRGFTPPSPVVRFNDIAGNAQAGLRVAGNITTPLDATCNYWGRSSGPTATAWPSGTGDAIVLEAGAATPAFTPFARSPNTPNGSGCGSMWTEPVNLGAVLNSDASEQNPSLSPDELSLYFISNRPGGQGGNDLWVSHRTSTRDGWSAPTNLGTVINTSAAEGGATFSPDGRLMVFFSNRPGGQGDLDVYVSSRADPNDDFAWGAPVNLGPLVNTPSQEAGPEFVDVGDGTALLLFNRREAPGATAPYHILAVPIDANGLPTAAPALVPDVNSAFSDFGPELSDDGLELFLVSGRPGTFGGNDMWRTTRLSVHDPWAPPENLGPVINTALNDRHPSLSNQGRTLIFASTRLGGLGSDDLWISTRSANR